VLSSRESRGIELWLGKIVFLSRSFTGATKLTKDHAKFAEEIIGKLKVARVILERQPQPVVALFRRRTYARECTNARRCSAGRLGTAAGTIWIAVAPN
jgi:hypothetical protein